MAYKRLKRHPIGLFDTPGRQNEDDEIGVLGGPGAGGGLFDKPARRRK